MILLRIKYNAAAVTRVFNIRRNAGNYALPGADTILNTIKIRAETGKEGSPACAVMCFRP